MCLGVDDDRTVVGVQDDPFILEERLSSVIYDSISPTPNVFFQTNIDFQKKILGCVISRNPRRRTVSTPYSEVRYHKTGISVVY